MTEDLDRRLAELSYTDALEALRQRDATIEEMGTRIQCMEERIADLAAIVEQASLPVTKDDTEAARRLVSAIRYQLETQGMSFGVPVSRKLAEQALAAVRGPLASENPRLRAELDAAKRAAGIAESHLRDAEASFARQREVITSTARLAIEKKAKREAESLAFNRAAWCAAASGLVVGAFPDIRGQQFNDAAELVRWVIQQHQTEVDRLKSGIRELLDRLDAWDEFELIERLLGADELRTLPGYDAPEAE